MILISKITKQIVLFFETIFPYLKQPIERCVETLLSSVPLDIDEKVKAFLFTPLYHGLKCVICQFNDSEKSSVPLFLEKQNT